MIFGTQLVESLPGKEMQKKVAEMEEEAAECSYLWDPGRKKGENTTSIIWKYGSYEKCASRGRKKEHWDCWEC